MLKIIKFNEQGAKLVDQISGSMYDIVNDYTNEGTDDRPVDIDSYNNISVLDYLAVVVSYMSPYGTSSDSVIRPNTYSLVTYEDKDGPYF